MLKPNPQQDQVSEDRTLKELAIKRDYKSESPPRGLVCHRSRKRPQECVHPEEKKVTVCKRRGEGLYRRNKPCWSSPRPSASRN